MPTENPKISAYVPQAIYDRFKQFQEEQGLSMSQAAIVILAEYFGLQQTLEDSGKGTAIGGVTLAQVQELELKLNGLESSFESRLLNLEHSNNEAAIGEITSAQVEELELKVSNLESSLNSRLLTVEEVLSNSITPTDNSSLISGLQSRLNSLEASFNDELLNSLLSRIEALEASKAMEPYGNATQVDKEPEDSLNNNPAREPQIKEHTIEQLAARLKLTPRTVKERIQEHFKGVGKPFEEWSQKKDPDHLQWIPIDNFRAKPIKQSLTWIDISTIKESQMTRVNDLDTLTDSESS